MAITVWTQPSGYSLGTITQRHGTSITLPLLFTLGLSFRVITGKLPPGLRLVDNKIIGTPYEVVRDTEFKFVIRASNALGISDRTFTITILSGGAPEWLTPAGTLPVGTNDAYFILDSSFIDFQLSVLDPAATTGRKLNFFIASNDGELPPGLVLTKSGRITGFVQPLLSIPVKAGNGAYDKNLYDNIAYDFGYRSTNGYDTYVYDLTIYDFSVPTARPRKLNRNYEFIATITDGDYITKRKFKIYVVGDDFFRADDAIMKAGTGAYTADVTYVHSPIFTTPAYLGLRRANNHLTFKIDTYEGFSDLGPIVYDLASVNAMISAICQKEIAGDNILGSYDIRIERASAPPPIGYKFTFSGEFVGATGTVYTIMDVDVLGGDSYRITVDQPLDYDIVDKTSIYFGTDSIIPPGMYFDKTNSEVFGSVPYQPAITTTYSFTIKAIRLGQGSENATSRRVFTVELLGEIESTMNWVSPSDIGYVDAGYISTLSIKATSTITTSAILYTIENGQLPPGLTLNLDGEIVGKVNQPNAELIYKSFWKPNKLYQQHNIIKQTNAREIKSLKRYRNRSYVVTTEDHNYQTGNLVEVISNQGTFNSFNSIEINNDLIKILTHQTLVSTSGNGPYRATFTIPTQTVAPAAPVFTSIKGVAASSAAWLNPIIVTSTSSSGSGTGARFSVYKDFNGTTNYSGLTTLLMLDPGTGYLPNDTITIAGNLLGGTTPANDLTFTTATGTEFWYLIKGNSNSKYNNRCFATASTTSTLTLNFDDNPGTFGSGLISVTTAPGEYEGETQIVPLNTFNYYNKGTTLSMRTATGTVYNQPTYYRATSTHTSGASFNLTNWAVYRFPESDRSITTFDAGTTTYDASAMSVDRKYTFTVHARDQLGYSAIDRTFTLLVKTPNNKFYSNVSARPFLKIAQRSSFKEFINDSTVFDPTLIYRANDLNFGIQRELRMLVYAGIETKQAVEYISAMGRNHKSKRFNFGAVKKAIAYEPGTTNAVYEVVYIEMVDPLEKNGKYLPSIIKESASKPNVTVDQNNQFYTGPFDQYNASWNRPIPFNATIDRNDVFAGDPGTRWRFPSSISIWRSRIKNMMDTTHERNYLPLWMRSIQPGNTLELDYVSAVPLCFCKPGGADSIILNIKYSSFDFKLLDYTVDRYIIDAVTGNYTDKYLVFRNDRTTIT